MELVPRITRAQAMDALSSQAALAGYYAALLGATNLARILPMMTTAVGSIRPAKALVMGLGVAGLQALATARRLGAMTEGYDVRPGDQGTGRIARREVRRHRRRCARRRRLCARADAGRKGQDRRRRHQAHSSGRHHHHDRRDSGPAFAEAHQQGAGRRHEGRQRDRRSRGGRRRQLRIHAAGRDGADRPGDDRRRRSTCRACSASTRASCTRRTRST